MQFFKSVRNGDILNLKGFLYNFDKDDGESERFRCCDRRRTGYETLDKGNKIVSTKPHDHGAVVEEIKRLEAINIPKYKTINTKERSLDIITDITE